MNLTDALTQVSSPKVGTPCKTGMILAGMSPEDRALFEEVRHEKHGVARLLASLRLMGTPVSEGALRRHFGASGGCQCD